MHRSQVVYPRTCCLPLLFSFGSVPELFTTVHYEACQACGRDIFASVSENEGSLPSGVEGSRKKK